MILFILVPLAYLMVAGIISALLFIKTSTWPRSTQRAATQAFVLALLWSPTLMGVGHGGLLPLPFALNLGFVLMGDGVDVPGLLKMGASAAATFGVITAYTLIAWKYPSRPRGSDKYTI